MFINEEKELDNLLSSSTIDDEDNPYDFKNDDPYSFDDENVDLELEIQISKEKNKLEIARLEAMAKSRERLKQLNSGTFFSATKTATTTSILDNTPASAFDTSLDTSSVIEDSLVSNPYVFDFDLSLPTTSLGSSENSSDSVVINKIAAKPIIVEKYMVKKVVQTNKLTVLFSWLISFGITAGLGLVLLGYFGVDPSKLDTVASQFSFLENQVWWIFAFIIAGLLVFLLTLMIFMVVSLHKKVTIINVTMKEKHEQIAAKEEFIKKAKEEAIRRYKIEKAKRIVAEHKKAEKIVNKAKQVNSGPIKRIVFDSKDINKYKLKSTDFEKLIISPRIIEDGNKFNVIRNYNNVLSQLKLIDDNFIENQEMTLTSNKMHELLQLKDNSKLELISPFYISRISSNEFGLSLSSWKSDNENIKQILITKPTKIRTNFLISNAKFSIPNSYISKLFIDKTSYADIVGEDDIKLIIHSNDSKIGSSLKSTINDFSNYLEKLPETQILILDGICYISSIVANGFMEPDVNDKSPEKVKKLLIDQIKIDSKYFKRLNKLFN